MPRERAALASLALGAAAALFASLLFARLGQPLFWHDEAETAAFAERVLAFGYPKAHDGRNTLYSLPPVLRAAGVGLHEASDAYTGSPWLQYYVGALGVALGAGSQDLHARSACVRLPFALASCAGLALLFLGVRPALGPGRTRALAFATLYLLLLATSVSLLLHLREARHYPLTVLGTGAFMGCFLCRQTQGSLGYAAYALGLGGSLLWLFHSFHPAALVLGASALLWLGGSAVRAGGSARARAAWLTREAAPLAAAALLTAPLLGFFDFLAQTQGWALHYGTASGWLGNAGFVAWTLLRHEWLLPALALRVAAEALARREAGRDAAAFAARLAGARFLSLCILVYALAMTGIPFLFERYFVVLGPLVCATLLLDLASVWDAARVEAARARSVARIALALAAMAWAGVLVARAPELAGRVHEIRHGYRGPLDFVIPYLVERYPDPAALVIATNYEEPAFIFYLGSRVPVGFYAAEAALDPGLVPDVIVPRPWPDQLEPLQQLETRARYQARAFPIANLRWNNTPSLSARIGAGTGHRFRDPVVGVDGPELVILERVPPSQEAPRSAPAAP